MPKYSHKFTAFIIGLLLSGLVAAAEPVALNPSHPDRYIVVKGDTLWDISARFLRDPWRWPEVWHINQQIENPHLIYPGDRIDLTYVNGQPRLGLTRGKRDVKLSPSVHTTDLDDAIPTIPVDAIKQFLTRPYVLDEAAINNAPYLVHFVDEHIVGGAGTGIYVRSIETGAAGNYEVVRPGKPYKDPDTGEVLGHEALYVGEADLQRTGDPAKMLLTRTEMEAIIGDRLLPVTEQMPLQNFHPKAPDQDIDGKIISVLNGVSQIGQYNVVVLNKGETDGLQAGDVLRIYQGGDVIRDQVTPMRGDTVTLPYEEAGLLMVFRTFSRVSFGLVMHATKAIHVLDAVRNPNN